MRRSTCSVDISSPHMRIQQAAADGLQRVHGERRMPAMSRGQAADGQTRAMPSTTAATVAG
jgi:hypothetical protein